MNPTEAGCVRLEPAHNVKVGTPICEWREWVANIGCNPVA